MKRISLKVFRGFQGTVMHAGGLVGKLIWANTTTEPGIDFFMLREDGGFILREDTGKIIRE